MAVHVGGKGPGHLARTQGLGGIDRSAYLDFRFGWPRSAYWLDGGLYDTFGSVPGAISAGGNNLGQAFRNGAWSGNLPDGTPLIGDGGLGVPEPKTEIVGLSCRPANAAWPIIGGTKAAGSGTYKGIYQAARVVSQGATWHRLTTPGPFPSVTSGQLYTVIARYLAGSSGRAVVTLTNFTSGFSSSARGVVSSLSAISAAAGALSHIETVAEGDGVFRAVLAWTPDFTGSIQNTGIGPDSTVAGEDIEVLGLSIQAGAYVNNPPIDNANLAATRTAVAQSVGGLVLPSGNFDIEQEFIAGPAGLISRPFECHNGSDNERLLVQVLGDGRVQASAVIAGVSTVIGTAPAGTAQAGVGLKTAIRRRGAAWQLAVNDNLIGSPVTLAVPAINAVILGQRRNNTEFLNSTISRHVWRAA